MFSIHERVRSELDLIGMVNPLLPPSTAFYRLLPPSTAFQVQILKGPDWQLLLTRIGDDNMIRLLSSHVILLQVSTGHKDVVGWRRHACCMSW